MFNDLTVQPFDNPLNNGVTMTNVHSATVDADGVALSTGQLLQVDGITVPET